MRFMVLVKATADSEAGRMPDPSLFVEMGKFNEALLAAGVMQGGDGLHPTVRGTRIDFKAEGVTDETPGPFDGEVQNIVSGYWLWECESMDAAVAWARRAPMPVGAQLEVRRVFTAEDFGDALPAEVKAKEDEMRAQLAKKG